MSEDRPMKAVDDDSFILPYVLKRLQHIQNVAMESNSKLTKLHDSLVGSEPTAPEDQISKEPEIYGMLNKLRTEVDKAVYLVEITHGNANVLDVTLSTKV